MSVAGGCEPLLRICLVISGRNDRGGVERHVIDLANGCSERSEVHVIADSSFVGHFDDRVVLHPVAFTLSRFSPRLLLTIGRIINSVGPDLVHAHGQKAARVLTIVDFNHRFPRVLTVHNAKPNPHLCAKFNRVITVTRSIASQIPHPTPITIPNGRG